MARINKIVLTFVIVLLWKPIAAQRIVIHNKADLYVATGIGIPLGASNFSNGPALLANMKTSNLFEIRFLQQLGRRFYLGADITQSTFSGWSNVSGSMYSGATTRLLSFSPILQFKINAQTLRSLGKFSLSVSVAPGLTRIFTNTTSESSINNTTPRTILTITSLRPGVSAELGVNYVASNSIGWFLAVSYSQVQANSRIYLENSFAFLNVKAGLFYRLQKDKKYKYSHQ